MRKLLLFRMGAAIPQILVVSVLAFALVYLIPGSPAAAILGADASPAAVAALESKLGLDRPPFERLADWLGGAVHGDLGESLAGSQPVMELLLDRLPTTLSLALGGITVALVLGITAGVIASARPGSVVDRLVTFVSSIGLAIPEFWLALILMLVFAVQLGWFPVISYTPFAVDPAAWLHGLVLPSLALGSGGAALIARQTRNAMISALEAPFIDTLRAAGTPWRRIVLRYALKNAMVPVLAVSGAQLAALVAASFVIEKIFAIPGIGDLLLGAIIDKDFPVVQGTVLAVACVTILINTVVDLGYGLLNPRVRPQ